METIIAMNNISKRYKRTKALDNFSVEVKKGDIYGLIGPNGAGKSTFIKVVTGLTTPSGGELHLFETSEVEKVRCNIGAIIETPAFFKNLTAKENLEFYCHQFGCDKNLIDACLEKVKLENVKNTKKFREYSLGMKQRLGIALALINSPELIILDEPTNGLDPVGIAELREIIKELNQNGVTFVICSHILSELSQIATKFGVINEGKLIKEFSAEELAQMVSDTTVIASRDFEKLQLLLKQKKIKFDVVTDMELEIKGFPMDIHNFAMEMIRDNVTIDAIYTKKVSLEDVFFGILNNGGIEHA